MAGYSLNVIILWWQPAPTCQVNLGKFGGSSKETTVTTQNSSTHSFTLSWALQNDFFTNVGFVGVSNGKKSRKGILYSRHILEISCIKSKGKYA